MNRDERRHAYWRKTLWLTTGLLAVWFAVTFGSSWFAIELNRIDFIGPLGYYMGAQGALIIYVAIIWYYARRMNALDGEYGAAEDDD